MLARAPEFQLDRIVLVRADILDRVRARAKTDRGACRWYLKLVLDWYNILVLPRRESHRGN